MEANLSINKNTKKDNVKARVIEKESLLDLFIHFFMFLSTLFIGADLIGLQVGINLRLDQLFLLITSFLMILNNDFRIKRDTSIIFFAIFSLISLILSVNIARGILYYFFIVFNIICVFYLYSNYIQKYSPKKFISLFRKTIYISFIVFIAQYLLKICFHYQFPFLPTYGEYFGIPRFRLWFYEPSYMATFFLFWFAFSLYMVLIGKYKSFKLDLVLTSIILILCTSTSGYIGIALTLFIIYLLWLNKGISLKKLSILIMIIVLFIVFRIVFSNIYHVFIDRLFEGSLDAASGGRISGWMETWNVFKDKPLFGVGPGCYGAYLGMPNDHMPTNVTLEVMATLGIFATISFFAIHLNLLTKSIKLYKKDKKNKVLMALCISLCVFIIILQFNQGYLRLYHWMFLGIINGFICYYKRIINTQNKQ